jgi:hypothetical protein
MRQTGINDPRFPHSQHALDLGHVAGLGLESPNTNKVI